MSSVFTDVKSEPSQEADVVPVFTKLLQSELQKVRANPSSFCCGGVADDLPSPELVVDGVGSIQLPLDPSQAKKLALPSNSEQAPFGRGLDTVVDTSVRRCRQVDATRVQVSLAWQEKVQQLAQKFATELGVDGTSVNANLYKLVLYEDGDFFKAHKDTEKEPGMFGTLVVQLPSLHKEGALVVRHLSAEKVFDFSANSDRNFYAAAFYGDCEHKLLPVKDGNRLCLIYNLVRPSKLEQASAATTCTPAHIPSLQRWGVDQDQLKRASSLWTQSITHATPSSLAFQLEHEYTDQNIAFANLKGQDASLAQLLLESGLFYVRLALVNIAVTGLPEGAEQGEFFDADNDDYPMGEEYDRFLSVRKWIDESDQQCKPPRRQIKDSTVDLFTGRALADTNEAPDELHFEDYTGNAGPSLEYVYRRALLAFWPKARHIAVLCGESFDAAHAHLKELVQNAASSSGQERQDVARATALHALHVVTEDVASSTFMVQKYGPNLLDISADLHDYQSALTVLKLLDHPLTDCADTLEEWFEGHFPGCGSSAASKAIQKAITAFGWNGELVQRVRAVINATPPLCIIHARQLVLALQDASESDDFGPAVRELSQTVAAKVLAIQRSPYFPASPTHMSLRRRKHFSTPEYQAALRRYDAVFYAIATSMLCVLPGCEASLQEFISHRSVQELPARELAVVMKETIKLCLKRKTLGDRIAVVERLLEKYIQAGSSGEDEVQTSAEKLMDCLVQAGHEPLLQRLVDSLPFMATGSSLFRTVCGSSTVRRATHLGAIQGLLRARIAQLRRPEPNADTNRQPEAHVPGRDDVTQFLRGDELELKVEPFKNVTEARKFIREHFGPVDEQVAKGYSAKAVARRSGRGAGKPAYVVITKTNDSYIARQKQWQDDQVELRELEQALASSPPRKRAK